MKKVENTLKVAIVATEFSHLFCCVLPVIFSLASLLAGLGMISAMPIWIKSLHDHIHEWEIPIIIFSGVMIALGWALHKYSQKIDCHDTGCCHPPCEPVKKKTSKVLVVATVLFTINVAVYFGLHRSGIIDLEHDNHAEHIHKTHDHHEH